MKKYNVYGLGNALVDTEIEVTDTDLSNLGVEKGLMTLVDEARQTYLVESLHHHLTVSRRACGGSAANSMIAVSRFGGRSFMSCRVGDDDNGHFYLQDLNKNGVDRCTETNQASGMTGKCLVMISPDAERTMNSYLGVSEQFNHTNLLLSAIEESEYLYIEGYLVTSPTARAAAIAARQHAQRHAVKIAMSLSDPGIVQFFKDSQKEMAGEIIDLLFCNEAEALSWTDSDDLEQALKALTQSARTFAVTLGSKGSICYDGFKLHRTAGQPVTAVDTNGAGDMYAGAFLYAITHGHDFAAAAHFANIAASAVVSQYGPRLHPGEYDGLKEALEEG